MKRNLSVALLATAMLLAVGATSHASSRAPKNRGNVTAHVASNAACPVGDPSKCQGSCPGHLTGAATVKVASKAGAKMDARACPVSDPSKCPQGCQTKSAATVAAVVTKH